MTAKRLLTTPGNSRLRQLRTVACFLTLMALVPGCQRRPTRPIGVVRGTVSLGEKPFGPGMIIFDNAAAGVTTTAPVQADGTYTVRTYNEAGLPVGPYRVAISRQQLASTGVSLVDSEPQKPRPILAAVPEKYRSLTTTPLTADVHEGDNPPFDFRLEP